MLNDIAKEKIGGRGGAALGGEVREEYGIVVIEKILL